jgi:sugar lactone lactonase YvrE
MLPNMLLAARFASVAALASVLAACGGTTMPPRNVGAAILPSLHTLTTIGSTVDPGPGVGAGDQNPYGLAIAPISAGALTAGDLVVCNFNDAANVQGTGTTIVALHPVAGATPTHLLQSSALLGCAALSLDPTDTIFTVALVADDAPIVSPAGALLNADTNAAWAGPWGAIVGNGFVFEAEELSGTIVRFTSSAGTIANVTPIITGISGNAGVPGSVLAAAGLTYDAANDTLYVVDGNTNRLLAFSSVSSLAANAIAIAGSGFSGPSAADARVVFSGTPLNGPISSALLANGDVVVGNTGDNNLVEIAPTGKLMAEKLVDTGATGAIFGIATSGTTAATQKIYFNDDNANAVMLVSP